MDHQIVDDYHDIGYSNDDGYTRYVNQQQQQQQQQGVAYQRTPQYYHDQHQHQQQQQEDYFHHHQQQQQQSHHHHYYYDPNGPWRQHDYTDPEDFTVETASPNSLSKFWMWMYQTTVGRNRYNDYNNNNNNNNNLFSSSTSSSPSTNWGVLLALLVVCFYQYFPSATIWTIWYKIREDGIVSCIVDTTFCVLDILRAYYQMGMELVRSIQQYSGITYVMGMVTNNNNNDRYPIHHPHHRHNNNNNNQNHHHRHLYDINGQSSSVSSSTTTTTMENIGGSLGGFFGHYVTHPSIIINVNNIITTRNGISDYKRRYR
jgi:hypothetical protein